MASPSRAALRSRYRNARRALSIHEQRSHARDAAKHLAVSGLMLAFERFAIYAASDGELDPTPIARTLLAAHKTVALPVVGPARRLTFHRYREDGHFVRNRFGIAEPDPRFERRIPTCILDVVLLPLVAFDDLGIRLGRGGGYYDATFGVRAGARPRALLIGLAHELQHHTDLAHRHWDVPLDGVITERGARGFTIRARRFMPNRII